MRVFNAHHSPIGAYSTFALGGPGRSGGLGMEAGMPPHQDVVVGIRTEGAGYDALPFFEAEPGDPLRPIDAAAVTRDFGATADSFAAGALTLRVLSPVRPVPEPGVASDDELRTALLPAVLAELTVDNSAGARPARAVFAIRAAIPPAPPLSPWGPTPRLVHASAFDGGFVLDDGAGRAAGAFCPEASAAAAAHLPDALDGPSGGAGRTGALRFDVPAGERATYRIALAFWHGGTVAAGPGLECSYWYARLFGGIEDVARAALAGFDAGAPLDDGDLSDDQRFQLAHATRSYYGNSALLATAGGRALWAVVEGEYMFVNTLDLTVDQLFYELRMNPWTVRNELDLFRERHSFSDSAGISFTHDMGSFPSFSAPDTSAYEQRLHMTSEELTNWTLTALTYVTQTGDERWADANAATLERCLEALVARDADGDGVMDVESDRLPPGGEEITTYDSLDDSLRRARRSTYLAGKQWAAYACLAEFLAARGREEPARTARERARRAARTLVGAAAATGYVPAQIAAGGEPANDARVIPVVEGLLFAIYAGAPAALEEDREYVATLARHLRSVLVPGACLFADGGWKISSTHDNSWLSKIFMAQFVARRILGMQWDEAGRAADAAHVAWLTGDELSAWAWSDQIVAGRVTASRYYPRGVTAVLWLEENPRTAALIPSS